MARKKVWLSWLPSAADGAQIQALTKALGKSGLAVDGAIWDRDITQLGWSQTASQLQDTAAADLWLIVGNAVDVADQSVRYGLSLAHAAVQSKRKQPLPTVVAGLDFAPESMALPTLWQRAHCLSPPATHWGAQLVALALRRPPPTEPGDFRLNVIAHPSLGQWFEIGPQAGRLWPGAIFGIDAGEITHQGVGLSEQLPQRCVLEYPSQGIRIDAAGHTFTCWAVRNTIDSGHSQYIRVVGSPARLLLGALPEQDEAELWVLDLV